MGHEDSRGHLTGVWLWGFFRGSGRLMINPFRELLVHPALD